MSKLGRISFMLAGTLVIAHAIYVETSRQDSPTALPLALRPSPVATSVLPAAPVSSTSSRVEDILNAEPGPIETGSIEQPEPVGGPLVAAEPEPQLPVADNANLSPGTSVSVPTANGSAVTRQSVSKSGKTLDVPQILANGPTTAVSPIELARKTPAASAPANVASTRLAARKTVSVPVSTKPAKPAKQPPLVALMPKPAVGAKLPPLHLAAAPASAPPIVNSPKPIPLVAAVPAATPSKAVSPDRSDEKVTVVSNYAQRLAHVNQQLDLGIERKWVSAAAAQRLKGKFEQLHAVEKSRHSKGYTRGTCDQMERDITQFSYWVTEAINGREISLSERENAL